MSQEPICPCEGFEHPVFPHNLSGLDRVIYRWGDLRTFRRALLLPLPNEVDLPAWRPNAYNDLLLQTAEWWAYIADVLTFYNERALNERLLRTATLDASVRGLITILGYRPRPGIAGSVKLGVLLSGTRPVLLPAGFRVQSKPAPGKEPQTFETSIVHTLTPPDAIPVAPPGVLSGPAKQLYLDGKIKSIKAGDLLLLTVKGTEQNGTTITVGQVNLHADSAGSSYTEIIPSGSPSLPSADASGYQLLQNRRSAGLWKYDTTINLISSPLELEGVDRAIHSGHAMVLRAPGTSLTPVSVNITGTTEQIWYSNGNGNVAPSSPTIPAGMPHTRIHHSGVSNTTGWNNEASKVQVLLGWEPAGTLRNVPITAYGGNPTTLIAQGGSQFLAGNTKTVLIEASDGNGALASGSVLASSPQSLAITSFGVDPVPALKTPLRVMQNVISLTRGKTVDPEILGVGNATQAPQEFTLKKSPLTYLPAGDSYKSTLRVFVDGVEWTEAKSFYSQPSNANIFVTREDDEHKTHVAFGDWINGAGLPTGAQVLAMYRIESGAENVPPGGISVIAKPIANVRGIRQPVIAGGGADPDPREQIRRYGPRSVLTFGRAISADDYDAIASRAPGVTRVRSYFAWNAQEQRATVTLYVGDDAAAVTSARNALLASADPNRQVSVLAATRVQALLLLAIRVDASRIVEDVVANVRHALADPDTGLFGSRRTGIGESIYYSQVSEACVEVPGVEAVTYALFFLDRPDPVLGPIPFYGIFLGLPPRINASAHEFLSIAPELVLIFPEVVTGV